MTVWRTLLLLMGVWCVEVGGEGTPVIFDHDGGIDDLLAFLLLLKHPVVRMTAVTVNGNGWGHASASVDMTYDVLAMMGRDDVPVGLGAFAPLVDQAERNECRYRQAVPGMINTDTALGAAREVLPRGRSHETGKTRGSVEVMAEVLSKAEANSTVLIATGTMTSVAMLLREYGELAKAKLRGIYVMGGSLEKTGVRWGGKGNVFTVPSNSEAEFNMYLDPLAAKEVVENTVGVPVYLVPLDATDRVPVSQGFFAGLEEVRLQTVEAGFAFDLLNRTKALWWSANFHTEYFVWDALAAAAAVDSSVVEFVQGRVVVEAPVPPVVVGNLEPAEQREGATSLTNGSDGAVVWYARTGNAEAFYSMYLTALADPSGAKRVTRWTQCSADKKDKEDKEDKEDGTDEGGEEGEEVVNLVFDHDMASDDVLALMYLLKVPREEVRLRALTVVANGWAHAHAVDYYYDMLHMMGRDDVAVGVGAFFATGESYPPFHSTGGCKYAGAVSEAARTGAGTNHGVFRRLLPRAPRWASPFNVRGAVEVMVEALEGSRNGSVVLVATGPLTNVAELLQKHGELAKAKLRGIYVMGGAVEDTGVRWTKGNVFTVPSNNEAEFNMYLDPLAAKAVVENTAGVPVVLVPLDATDTVPLSEGFFNRLEAERATPEAELVYQTIKTIKDGWWSPNFHSEYFAWDPLAAVFAMRAEIADDVITTPLKVNATGDISTDGITYKDPNGTPVTYVVKADAEAFYTEYLARLNDKKHSATVTWATQCPP